MKKIYNTPAVEAVTATCMLMQAPSILGGKVEGTSSAPAVGEAPARKANPLNGQINLN